MARSRLGVALLLPDPVAAEVDGLRRALGSGALGRIAPHLTLVPPVNVVDGRLDEAVSVVRGAGSACPPVRLLLGPVATFWPDTPVLYLVVDGDLAALRRLRRDVFTGPLARPVTWPFVPHVTLAEEVDPAALGAAVAALSHYRADLTVDGVQVLVERAGRRWEVLADVPLGGATVVGRGGLPLELETGDVPDPEAALAVRAWTVPGPSGTGHGPVPPARPFAVSARREGRVVGAAEGTTDDELWVGPLVVDPAVRGQGVGSRLLAEVEALGARRGCRRGWLVCEAGAPLAAWLGSRGWREDLALPDWRHRRPFVRMGRTLGR